MALRTSGFFPNPLYSPPRPFRQNNQLKLFTLLLAGFWVFTGGTASDLLNWLLENTLTIPAVVLLVQFYRKMPFSNTSYALILLFLLLHLYGSQTAYAENPFGFWLQEQVGTTRNHYDRLVHFSFGFLLAYPLQEMLFKATKVRSWQLYLMPVELTLSLSAFYEIVEWLVAGVLVPTAGTAFLGTQGDIWDAQKDMFLASVGAFITMVLVLIWRKAKAGNAKTVGVTG